MIKNDYKVIDRASLCSEDVVGIAQSLLGKLIVSCDRENTMVVRIVETEAYCAPEDKASHAYNCRRTLRNEVMYGAAGIAYIYLCYGLHHLFNVVTGVAGVAHAVLIRATEPICGVEIMSKNRNLKVESISMTNGPGKWTKALNITTDVNGVDLCDPDGAVRLCEDDYKLSAADIIASQRVGIAYADEWAQKLWRFRIKNNRWTSLPYQVKY